MSLPTNTRPPKPTDPSATVKPLVATPEAAAPSPLNMPAKITPAEESQKQRYQRGDIWLVAEDPLHPPVGTELWSNRPAIVVSNNVTGNNCGFVQIVYLTTSTRKRTGPTHIVVPAPLTGISHKGPASTEAMALCEQIHTVDVSRLRKPLGALSRNIMREIDQALALTLSIGRNPDSYALFKKWEKYIQLHGIDMAEEIQALAGHTTDQRVEALTRALDLVRSQRDSYKVLYETAQVEPEVLRRANELVTGQIPLIEIPAA